jgi:hypothetical protein
MLLIREVFFCKPGQVKPLLEKFKTMNSVSRKRGLGIARLMTDLSAERYWTVVSEWEVKSLHEFEELMAKSMADTEMEEAMKGYHELVDHGRREIYKVET